MEIGCQSSLCGRCFRSRVAEGSVFLGLMQHHILALGLEQNPDQYIRLLWNQLSYQRFPFELTTLLKAATIQPGKSLK
jgi:hypothetical protein